MSAKQKNKCHICFKNKGGPVGPFCGWHGKTGGGSSGSGSGESAGETHGVSGSAKHEKVNFSARPENTSKASADGALANADRTLTLNPLDIKFNQDIISDMLANKTLVIDNNPELGTLRITCLLKHLSKSQHLELDKYLNALLRAFEQFKDENQVNGARVQVRRDEFIISLPKPGLYDKFIAKLAAMNLLPQQAINQATQAVYLANTNHFNPTPFSTKPVQGGHKKPHHEAEVKANKRGKMNPFDIHSGPKPKDA
jgi:hypothetical protein